MGQTDDLTYKQVDDPIEIITLEEDFECPACGEIIKAGEEVILDYEYYQMKHVAVYTCKECCE